MSWGENQLRDLQWDMVSWSFLLNSRDPKEATKEPYFFGSDYWALNQLACTAWCELSCAELEADWCVATSQVNVPPHQQNCANGGGDLWRSVATGGAY